MTTLYIRNMVCDRCKLVVKQEMEKLGLHTASVSLGKVILSETDIADDLKIKIGTALIKAGFERIDDRKARLIESIKNMVIDMIHHTDKINTKVNWSDIISMELHYEYNYLSALFSSVEGITLEQFIIRQKIERVKELLFYDELNLSEIAFQLGYSSVAHLSAQFKKVTGFTPSALKKSRQVDQSRKSRDHVS